MHRSPEELRALVEGYLAELAFTPELGALEEALRYPLESGGKRVRPVISLAVAEAAGAVAEHCLPAAAAVELVHTFSLVHDDLPAMDDDDERRGRPSVHIAFDEATALLAGDALLAEAFRLALSYPTPMVGRELAQATLGMIGGQYRDVTGETDDLAALHRLKTGALFSAAVGVALWVAEVPEGEQPPWRAFGEELGLLFQAIDDLLDGDGYAAARGEARRGSSPTNRRRARTSGSRRFRRTRACSPRSSRASPRARPRCSRRRTCWPRSESVGEPEPLGGGQGSAWRSGDLVLKPLDWAMSPEELEWQGAVLGAVRQDGFRVPRLRRAATARRSWTAGARGSTSRAATRSVAGQT